MSVRLTYDSGASYLLATFDGPLSEIDFGEALRSITTTAVHPPNVSVLWDLRSAGFQHASRSLVRRLDRVRRQYEARSGARVAAVVPDDLGFGIMRMLEAYGADIPIVSGIFRTMEEAIDWLLDSGS